MAGNINPVSAFQDYALAGGQDVTAANRAGASNVAPEKETFLKLLVAQIRHQNPLEPADGVQFLSQLAQFTELEQTMGIRAEIEGLRADIAAIEAKAQQTSGD